MKLWDKIKIIAESTPDKDAFITITANGLCYKKINYSTFTRAVEKCFKTLPRLAGKRVGLMVSNRPLWAIYDLALTLKGATVVPIPHFFSKAQCEHITGDAALELIITEDFTRNDGRVPDTDNFATPIIKADASLEEPTMVAPREPCANPSEFTGAIAPEDNPSGVAKIIYTSGTTGTPKGVMISARAINIVTSSLIERTEVGSEDRHLSLLPLATLIETIGGLYVPLYCGATIIYPDPCNAGSNPSALLISSLEYASLIQKTRATTLNLVPAILEDIIKAAEDKKTSIPETLRFVACGGARLSEATIEKARALNIPLYQGFGLSECTTVVAVNSTDNNRPGSVGTPLPHVSIRISNDKEIIIESAALMMGYLNTASSKDRTTRQEITQWATGDLGYLDSGGFLYVTGRKDSAFATSAGRNISPEWIENELLTSNAVSQTIVYGAGLPYPMALIVPNADWLLQADKDTTKNKEVVKEPIKDLLKKPLIRERLIKELELSMAALPEYATVKEFIFMESPFSKEAEEVSPSGTLKRKEILNKYTGSLKPETV